MSKQGLNPKKSLDSALTKLRQLAAQDAVEFEHLSEIAQLGSAAAVPVLRELQQQYAWSSDFPESFQKWVPLGRWVDVICIYLEGGVEALVAHARCDESRSFDAVVSILSDIKTTPSAQALARLATEVERNYPERIIDAVKLAETVNLVMSFKCAPVLDEPTISKLREFLHRLLQQELKSAQRALAVCALRGVGDEDSVDLISKLPKFDDPWRGLESIAIKAIRKRISKLRQS